MSETPCENCAALSKELDEALTRNVQLGMSARSHETISNQTRKVLIGNIGDDWCVVHWKRTHPDELWVLLGVIPSSSAEAARESARRLLSD